MTGKLPVERVIVDAYRFGFAGFFSVLGTLWLPYLLLILIAFGLIRLIAPDVPQMLHSGEIDLGVGMELIRFAIIVGIFAFIVGAMVTVDLQNKAMGRKTGPRWYYFSLSGTVWRMAAASFLIAIVICIVVVGIVLICVAISSAAGAIAAGGLIRVIAILAAIAVIVYVSLRLTFFLPAVVVAEKSLGLERSWNLGGHNFWRILLVAIAVVLPLVIVSSLVSWALAGPLPGLHDVAGQGALKMLLRGSAFQSGPRGYLMLALEIIERVLLIGLINGAIASAYLAVSGVSTGAVPPAAQ